MSASPSIDAFDAQMLDFSSDPDVPMHITGSAEFFQEALMEHDGHFATSSYSEHASVEVDMEEYVGDNAEYEMADETPEFHRLHGEDLLDIEVCDASHAASPLVPPQLLQSSVDVSFHSENLASVSPAFSEQTAAPAPESESEVQSAPLDHLAADATHVEPLPSLVDVSSEVVVSEPAHPAEPLHEGVSAASESYEQPSDGNRQQLEASAPAGVADGPEPHVPDAEEHLTHSEEVQHETSEPLVVESARPAADTDDSGALIQNEKAPDQAPETEAETAVPHQLSDGNYYPPPAVLLSVTDFSEPSFALFSQPVPEGEFREETDNNQKVFSLLLENRPSLYYDSLNNVFEALRQDEGLLSRVPHSFEGELVLDAYDLQLAVSEDNVHAREITLHDLNDLHQGSDFVGPLRLLLRAIVPRFIIRYYALQEQIQRLNVATETGEGAHDNEQHQHYDLYEDQQPQQEEATGHPSAYTAVTSEGLEGPPTADAEELATEVPSLTEETEQQEYEEEDTTTVEEPAAEYHEVAGEAAHALEDEDDYSGTNAGEEDEISSSEGLDADQVHEAAAEDTDAPATVTGQGSEFGGEQSEYLDYVQPEEYDERYGEDLPERAGGASLVQYGESVHYEESEQDTSTVVDETQVILPGSDGDGDGENKSVATPIPARATLELDANSLADENPSGESALPKQEKNDTSSTDESLHKDAQKPSGNRETSVAQANILSETEESDFNLLSTLERQAEAEFEQSFSAEQSNQEVSIEATLQNDETWADEWDDEDAEGEDEEDWMDPDAASNESSVTLESKASSKRSYDEVEPSEEPYVGDPNSPGKRPRVQ